MSATSILRARKMINGLNYEEMKAMAAKAVELDRMEDVVELVKKSIQ
jgi:phosphoenolpyruvate-protein kinase (PTS system EI component)